MSKKDVWLSVQAVTVFCEMWDAAPRSYPFAIAVMRIWTGYLLTGSIGSSKAHHRGALGFVENLVAETRPHYNSRDWQGTKLCLTREFARQLSQTSQSESHRMRNNT